MPVTDELPSEETPEPVLNRKWYAVHTKPRQELLALQNLENQKYRCFLPRIQVKRIRRGKSQPVIEPFFTSYLFIQLVLEQTNIAPIRSTLGVTGLVRFGGYIPPVNDALVESLIARADANSILPSPEPEPAEFAPGQQVWIQEGPLAGCEAIFQARNGQERALLLIQILGDSTRVQVPIRTLASNGTRAC